MTASSKIYALLRQRVVSGSYAPGEQLKEERLSQELEMSRTPVRAALKQLVADGLAVYETGRGVKVAEWTDSDIQETYQLRMLLEGHAAALAAQRGGTVLADVLDSLNTQMRQVLREGGASLSERMQELNQRFHGALVDASASPRLRALLSPLVDMPVVTRFFFVSTAEDMQQSLSHHIDLATAVRAGDAALARQVMQVHLRVAAQKFRELRASRR